MSKGSEPRAVCSGVLLAVARPHPSEKATRTGIGIVVLAVVGLSTVFFFFLTVLLFVPTLAPLCRQERLHMGCCHV